MDYIFSPYKGIGPMRFGMSPSEVNACLGSPPSRPSPRSPVTKTWKAYYSTLGLLVVFDDQDRCSSVTILPEGTLLLHGVDLISLSYPKLKAFLHENGYNFVEEDSGLKCNDIGLESWKSDRDEDEQTSCEDRFECLFIFRPGHDEYMKALVDAWE